MLSGLFACHLIGQRCEKEVYVARLYCSGAMATKGPNPQLVFKTLS